MLCTPPGGIAADEQLDQRTAFGLDQMVLSSCSISNLILMNERTEQPPTKVGGFVQGTESP